MILEPARSAGLHRYAIATAAAALVLLMAGATVTSTGSGLSVPDWPLSYGKVFPAMRGGVLFEHGHRMIAGAVTVMVAGLILWMRRAERRAWVRRLAYAAGLLIVAQALLGGLTVLLQLPPAVSVAHAGMAQVVFALLLCIAVVTSAAWRRSAAGVSPGAQQLAPRAAATAAILYAQILIGAIMRHTGAGLACPDFPLCNGRLVPPLDSFFVAIHFVHRLGALISGLAVWTLTALAERRAREDRGLVRLARAAAALVAVQIVLGALAVVTRLAVPITVAHLAVGALLFGTVLVLTAWSYRLARRQPAAVPVAVPAVGATP